MPLKRMFRGHNRKRSHDLGKGGGTETIKPLRTRREGSFYLGMQRWTHLQFLFSEWVATEHVLTYGQTGASFEATN